MAELKRTLGFWLTSAFVFLNLVNTGIFFGVPLAIGVAGIDSIVAWVLLAFVSVYTGMCFAELTTMFPKAGGIYEFSKQAYGRFVSFEVGWVIWLINNIATALLIAAAVEYLFPGGASFAFGSILVPAVLFKVAVSCGIILLMNYIAFKGADESAKLMLILAIFTVVLLLLVIVPGAMQMNMAHFTGFTWDWALILIAAFLLSETFFGWESITFMAEEIKNPEKTIPKALNMTTGFVAIASVLVAAVTIGTLGINALQGAAGIRPLLSVLQSVGLAPWLILLANIGVVVTFLGNAAGGVIGNPRLLLALSRDKLFIEQFSDVHPRYQTPYKGIILQTIVAILIAIVVSGAYQQLLKLVVAPSLILYALIIFLVPYLRWKMPKTKRVFRAPFGKVIPLVLAVFFLLLLGVWIFYDSTALIQIRLLFGFILFSLPIYLVLTYFYDPDTLIKTINKFAVISWGLESVIVPKHVRKKVFGILQNIEGKHLLEFGSGVGTMTMEFAEKVGVQGGILAVDLSEKNLEILQKRLEKKGHKHVKSWHDPHLINRVHPYVHKVDLIVSIGNLSYVQDLNKVLGEMYDVLPSSGRICFVEYIDLFWFLPNQPAWLSKPAKIKELFSKAGFNVNVETRRGLFWKYLYIYGIKHKGGGTYI